MPVERESFTGTEIRAGIMVLLSGAVLVLFIVAMLNYRPLAETKTYTVSLSDTGGVGPAADVRFGGIVVGRVTRVEPNPDNQTELLVTVEVDETIPVNEASRAYVGQATLTSEKHIEITTGSQGAKVLEDGAVIPATTSAGPFGDLDAVTKGMEALLTDVRLLLGVTDAEGEHQFGVRKDQTLADVLETIEGLASDIRVVIGVVDKQGNLIEMEDDRTMREIMVSLDDAVQSADEVLTQSRDILAENRDTLKEGLQEARDMAAAAERMVEDVRSLVNDNRETIESTLDGADELVHEFSDLAERIDKLVITLQDTVDASSPAIEDALRNLNNTLENLEEVTRTLSEQPQSVLRGVEPQGRQ